MVNGAEECVRACCAPALGAHSDATTTVSNPSPTLMLEAHAQGQVQVKSERDLSEANGRMTEHLWTTTSEIFGNCGKLFQGSSKISHDVSGDDFRRGQVRRLFERIVLQQEDVQVQLVALCQLLVRE